MAAAGPSADFGTRNAEQSRQTVAGQIIPHSALRAPRSDRSPGFRLPQAQARNFRGRLFLAWLPKHATKPKNNRAFWRKKLAANERRDVRVTRALRRSGWRVVCFVRFSRCYREFETSPNSIPDRGGEGGFNGRGIEFVPRLRQNRVGPRAKVLRQTPGSRRESSATRPAARGRRRRAPAPAWCAGRRRGP
jgi:hypothetical protein